LARGRTVILAALATLPARSGVYRMQDASGVALYVGKAKDLKRRVASYAKTANLPVRLKRMVAQTAEVEIVTTHTEAEALLLESNLIKRLKPRYNVLLRDDKSFPSILITDHEWPQLTKHRGAHSRKGRYFGPFASAGAVNNTMAALERAFLLRSCSDSVFESRTRPCLLFQIKRCSGPCVQRISRDDYAALVREACDFLSGKSADIQQRLAKRMEEASGELDFERAAFHRDRIRALTQIQAHQDINLPGLEDFDLVAAHQAGGHTAIQVFFFRAGRNYGNRSYFPKHDPHIRTGEVLTAFLGQFYAGNAPPPLVVVSHKPSEPKVLEQALSELAQHRVRLLCPARGAKHNLVKRALENAREALGRRMAESATQRRLLERVAEVFGLESPPERIEVYDNSHVFGTHAAGAMIVAGPEGLMKNAYRKFTIRNLDGGAAPDQPVPAKPAAAPKGGDDYAMMREVLTRRFARALREDPERANGNWPDLILIDGGAGHLSTTREVLADLGIADVAVAAIAKGPERNAGRERLFLPNRPPLSLDPQDPVLYFLQRLRDEAHRFAIGAHRAKRSKAIGRSILDEIPGIGARRKRALLHHFGSARSVAGAGLADLELVDGIDKAVAKKIYDHFHDGG
jgi:excinuclease ABC subunit C